MIRHPPRSTLFPSTPLSRSNRHRVLAALHQDPPLLEQTCRLNQALRPLRFGEKHIDHKECCDCEEGQPESSRSEEHTSELQSPCNLVCRLLLEKKKTAYLMITTAPTIDTLDSRVLSDIATRVPVGPRIIANNPATQRLTLFATFAAQSCSVAAK